MATPQSSASYSGDAEPKRSEQITFRFCSECSNMLYPKEDEDAHRLQFTCRTCQYTEPAQSSCIYRNKLNTSAGETAGVTQDVGSDPTVSSPFPCRKHRLPVVICICCGSTISCEICGRPCHDVNLPRAAVPNKDKRDDYDKSDHVVTSAACGFTLDWGEEDIFEEDGESTAEDY